MEVLTEEKETSHVGLLFTRLLDNLLRQAYWLLFNGSTVANGKLSQLAGDFADDPPSGGNVL